MLEIAVWHDVKDMLPDDGKQKLVVVENYMQHRRYFALAYYDEVNHWGSMPGHVTHWMDTPPMPEVDG